MKTLLAAGAAVLSLSFVAQAQAATELVSDGNFSQLSTLAGASHKATTAGGQLGYNMTAAGWSTQGYNYVFTPGSADTTGANGSYGKLGLWGPKDGSNNGFTAASPTGGNFLAADGDFQTAPVTQVISGLVAGKTYDLTFAYAFAQQSGFNGDTVQNWTASLGKQAFTTKDFALGSHGFSGWMKASDIFTATSATETLSFLAYGDKPAPPFALLSNVSMTATGGAPEPETWTMMILGVGLVGAVMRRRRALERRQAAQAAQAA